MKKAMKLLCLSFFAIAILMGCVNDREFVVPPDEVEQQNDPDWKIIKKPGSNH